MPQSAAKTLASTRGGSSTRAWRDGKRVRSGFATWRIDREALTFLGAGRALLLQLAHPWVAAAIAEHSKTIDDPIGRFHRTFAVVFTMVFGTLDQALSAARALHRRHAAIHGRLPITVGPFRAGSPYQANDLAALRWTYATLVETALMTHDFVLPPLTGEERARYYAESHRFAGLFGIPRATLPADWREFATYAEMMRHPRADRSPAAREIARQIFSGAGSLLLPPQWYRAVTASMLPPRLREAFGLSDADSSQSERARVWLRRIYRQLPGCAMSVRTKKRWRGCQGKRRRTSLRGRSTGSGSDATRWLDEFIT